MGDRQRLRKQYGSIGEKSTDHQHATALEHLNTLRRKLEAWFKIQQSYVPGVQNLRDLQMRTLKNPAVFDMPLLLPSALRAPHIPSLWDIEWRLRYAQAHDALEGVRRHLRLCSHLYHFKDRFVHGQGPNTRARSVIKKAQDKVDEHADRYRRARAALVSLSTILGKAGWEGTLKTLADEDVRQMTEGMPGQSEGKRTLSWIWRTTPLVGPEDVDDPELQEGTIFGDRPSNR